MVIQKTGLSQQLVEECIERRLVKQPLTDADFAELRRIRRLQELGVNIQGIEVILRMRRRMKTLQSELARRNRLWSGLLWSEADDLWQKRLPADPESNTDTETE
jgi:DNA-binding transcriptional MerR regulator